MKIFKSLSRPYEALADIFRDGTLQRLEAEISVGIDLWDRVSLKECFSGSLIPRCDMILTYSRMGTPTLYTSFLLRIVGSLF